MMSLAKRLLRLKAENFRLIAAERLSLLLENILFIILAFLLGVCFMGFVAFALVHFLADFMQPGLAYLCVAGLYAIIIAVLIIFRRSLIGDPIARLVSRLILDEPKTPTDQK